MARATNSFPVPLSPVTSTVASVGATVSMESKTCFIAAIRRSPGEGVGGRNRFDGIEDMLHRRALSNDVGGMRNFGNRLFQPRVLLLGAAMRHGFGDQVGDLVRIERLIDVVIGAVLERRNGR